MNKSIMFAVVFNNFSLYFHTNDFIYVMVLVPFIKMMTNYVIKVKAYIFLKCSVI